MSQVKMGVLGCGSISEIAHLPAIAKTEGLILHAVCDTNEKTAKSAKEKWKAKKYYTDYKEMFADADLDGVIIATPNNVHRNQALAAAKAGVHVIIEKHDQQHRCRKDIGVHEVDTVGFIVLDIIGPIP